MGYCVIMSTRNEIIDLLEDDDTLEDNSNDEFQLINEDNLLDEVDDMIEDLEQSVMLLKSEDSIEEDSLVGDQRDYENYQNQDTQDSSIDLEGRYDDDLVEEDMLDDSLEDNSNDEQNNVADFGNLEKDELQKLVNVFQKQISYMKNRLVTLQQELQKKNHINENLTWRYESGDLPSNADTKSPDTNSVEDMRNLMMKSELIAQKTMLENFELRE